MHFIALPIGYLPVMVEIILPPSSFIISVAEPHFSDFGADKGCDPLWSLLVSVADIAASSEVGDGVERSCANTVVKNASNIITMRGAERFMLLPPYLVI